MKGRFEIITTTQLHEAAQIIIRSFLRKGACGGVVVESLRYKPEVAGSISDAVTGFFH
jgi:hypothetical protein